MATKNQSGPWRLDIHVIQNRHTHRRPRDTLGQDKQKLAYIIKTAIQFFSFSQCCVSCSYDWGVFGPRE